MKLFLLIIMVSIGVGLNSCTRKKKDIDKSNYKILQTNEDTNNNKYTKLNNDKSIVLKSEVNGVHFLVRKEINGQFMVDQNYFEQLKIEYGDCHLNIPRTYGQAKISTFLKTLKHDDWDNDGKTDWEFIYRVNQDGLDYEIHYILISNCQIFRVKNIFYEDEDTFIEEYEDEISHIKNIKNARDYYRRNFVYQISKLLDINNALKIHAENSFMKFIDDKVYLNK